MIEDPDFRLTTETAADYAHSAGLFDSHDELTVRLLAGGVSNAVIRVESADRALVLKQPYRRLNVEYEWVIDRSRVWREIDGIQQWSRYLGPGWVPEIVHVDRPSYIYAMTAAPRGARSWKEHLLEGDVSPDVADRVGRALGTAHRASAEDRSLAERFPMDLFFQARIDPYFVPLTLRYAHLGRVLTSLIRRLFDRRIALVHGDYSPKNIMVHPSGITILDFEVVHVGDPSFDAAFLASHLILKTVHAPAHAAVLMRALETFWTAYCTAYDVAAPSDLEETTIATTGALLLARVDGKSRVEYLSSRFKVELVRAIGTQFLINPPPTMGDACRDVVPVMTHSLERGRLARSVRTP